MISKKWRSRPAMTAVFVSLALFPLTLVCSASRAPRQAPAAAPTQAAPSAAQRPLPPGSFTNPIVRSRGAADPWLVYRDGFYYFTFTAGKSVEIWKSPTITGLDNAKKVTVWRAPNTGPNSEDVWAPEIHFVRGKWYIYYTATNAGPDRDVNRRQFVLEAATDDPQGAYVEKGRLFVPGEDVYAIDGSIIEAKDGNLYYLWSGREGSGGGRQNIFIAAMENPWTLKGPRVRLSSPTYPWEKIGWSVNEGPELLQRGNTSTIIYSASGGTTPDYCLGQLVNRDGNLLRPASWTKSPVPVFSKYTGPDGSVFTPGHNGFCVSPDGKENWIVYHGKETSANTWAGRMARAQRFWWNDDGTPNFGHPVPSGVPLALPGGEPGSVKVKSGKGSGLRARYFAGRGFAGKPLVTRLDKTLLFDWGLDSPAPSLPVDGFSARWTGSIEPRYTDMYTFQTYADDGVRVTINSKKVIDNWTEHAPTADEGKITLVAGRRYPITVEYFENINTSQASLYWSSPQQPFEPVPATQLYPGK